MALKLVKGTPEYIEEKLPLLIEEIKEMQDNPFIVNAKEIKEFCDKHSVDVGVGLDMYINLHYPTKKEKEDINEEHLRQYHDVCRRYYLNLVVDAQVAVEALPPEPVEEVVEEATA